MHVHFTQTDTIAGRGEGVHYIHDLEHLSPGKLLGSSMPIKNTSMTWRVRNGANGRRHFQPQRIGPHQTRQKSNMALVRLTRSYVFEHQIFQFVVAVGPTGSHLGTE